MWVRLKSYSINQADLELMVITPPQLPDILKTEVSVYISPCKAPGNIAEEGRQDVRARGTRMS